MSNNNYNPGTVNTEAVINNATGVSSSVKSDGTIHSTAFDRSSNSRISWNEHTDGSIDGVHSTRQDDNSHIDYKGAK